MRRIHIAHSRCKQGFQRGAAPLAHDFGTKSSVLHLSRGVQTSDMQKNHANTLTVQTWDLMLPRSSRVPVTNPDRHLPCHFSKTVLRIPSSWAHPVFYYASSFSMRSIRYPTPTWVWIRCGASGHRSSFLRRDAI